MKVTFDDCLVCDVRKTTFEDKTYHSLIVYQDSQLYRISISSDSVDSFIDEIGQMISFEADMTVYNGKSKFKII